jgi:hypothetical protein
MAGKAPFPVDCLDNVCSFAAPALLAKLASVSREVHARASAHLYSRLKVVHFKSSEFYEQHEDDKELLINQLPGIVRRYGQYISTLTYYGEEGACNVGDMQDVAKDASYFLVDALGQVPYLRDFRWSAPYPPHLDVFWTKLQKCPTLRIVHLEVADLDIVHSGPDLFGIEVRFAGPGGRVLTRSIRQTLLAFRNLAGLHLTGRRDTNSWTFGNISFRTARRR